MNVFVIPSWYPSEAALSLGIFIKEQTELLGDRYKHSINIGISLWGQNDDRYLLYAKEGFNNIGKALRADTTFSESTIAQNMKLYQSPTFTWSRKVLTGNLRQIVESNLSNLKRFEAEFGKVDLIHAHVGYPAGRIALEIVKKRAIPYIITEHLIPFPSKYDTNRNGIIKESYLKNYLAASANIAVSPYLSELMTACGITNIKVIPNFISEDLFKPIPTSDHATDQFTFLFVGDMIHRKGLDLLLLALSKILEEKKHIRCRICGSGEQISQYKTLATELGISSSIDWLGELDREAVSKEMSQCDAFVLPSRDESMGVVYIEALACGKPIIATKCGGPENIVTPFNGLLVENDNPAELAQAMLAMIERKDQYDPLIIREDFLNRLSSKVVLPQLYNLYKEVVEKSNCSK